VVGLFRAHPEVGFYRNRVRVIDAAGTAIPVPRWREHEVDPGLDRTGPVLLAPDGKAGALPLLTTETTASFNSSTMVVRRALLEREPGEEFDRTQLPDLTLLIAAVLSPYGLYLDDRRLTRFRFYDSNVTSRIGWLRHAAEAHAALGAWTRRRGREDFAGWLDQLSAHYERLFRSATLVAEVRSGAPRESVAAHMVEYLRFLGRHPAESGTEIGVWTPEMDGFAYLLWPALGRRFATARRTVREG
jgi:hypothetical protein